MQSEPLSCETARERISARLDGEDRRPEALAIHLEGCAACQAHERALMGLSSAFAKLRAAEVPQVNVWPSIELRARSRPRSAIAARAAAALIGFASVGVVAMALERRRAAPSERHLLERLTALDGSAELLAAVPELRVLRAMPRVEDRR
jgi:predicted anti-sigma-YlaC factor YlaD